MDCRWRLDALRHVPAESPASHSRRRPAGRQAIPQRRPGHDGLVRAGASCNGEGLVITQNVVNRWLFPVLLLASMTAAANMAEQGHRVTAAGIDVVAYPT